MQKLSIFGSALLFFLIFGTYNAFGATVFYANGAFTPNGIEWCQENEGLYDILGDKFFEHHRHSIESRICVNLIEDPLWHYEGPDKIEKLIERSLYFSELEIAESKEEATGGVLDPKPAEVPDRVIEDELVEEIEEEIEEEKLEQTLQPPPVLEDMENEIKENDDGGGCLIATAAFNSELSNQVQDLREIRDNTLLKTSSGAAFMTGFNEFYYSFSPTVADWQRHSPLFKEAVKLTITPMIASLSILTYMEVNSEAEVIGYGGSLILLNIVMYIAAPVKLGLVIKKKAKSFKKHN